MTIDNDAAGLLAQVIPALLVFLALEDRLMPSRVPNRAVRRHLSKWREGAVGMNLLALAMCLLIVVTDVEKSPVVTMLNSFIAISVLALLVVLAMLLIAMFALEDTTLEDPV